MDTVGAFEAKTHFASLLERVAKGETITITKHGHPIAKLVPVTAVANQQRRAEAVARLKEFAKRHSLGGLDWKALRDEGKK
ncbi:MAG TPA: type II toxin-antitoxin system prevent-host-death family antitoxin [Alphaproteobacteria bacterium]|jgi:prevent-host-death family protein